MAMTHVNPDDRPNAQEVLELWKEAKNTVSHLNRIWRLQERGDGPLDSALWDAISFVRRGSRISLWAPDLLQLKL